MISQRGQVPPFRVMRVLAAAQQRRADGRATYDLSAGQPSTPAPEAVRAAAKRALAEDRLGYTAAAGLPQLREAIAQHYQVRYGLAVDAANVVVTTGSSGGILLALLAAFDPDDQVALTRPGYPAYRNLVSALGCVPVDIDCGPDVDFRLDVAALRDLPAVPAGLMLASPANPTGTGLSPQQLAAIAQWCDSGGVRLISDEIYHGIRYEGRDACAWEFSRSAIVVNSFSKYFAMTGWRLGWLLVPDELLDSIDRLATNVALCAPTLSQWAALAAFDDYAARDEQVRQYRRNRDQLTAGLRAAGVDSIAPADGAFYLYADVSRWTRDSADFAARLLAEAGVAVAPGIDFDDQSGPRFIRLSFAGEDVGPSVDVLTDWLGRQPI